MCLCLNHFPPDLVRFCTSFNWSGPNPSRLWDGLPISICRKSAMLINSYVGKMQYCKDYVGLVQYLCVGQVQYPLGLSEKCITKDCRKTAEVMCRTKTWTSSYAWSVLGVFFKFHVTLCVCVLTIFPHLVRFCTRFNWSGLIRAGCEMVWSQHASLRYLRDRERSKRQIKRDQKDRQKYF